MKKIIFILSFLILVSATVHSQKPRLIVLTDISNPSWKTGSKEENPDDYQSLTRLLLYANEIDIKGIIATSSCWMTYYQVANPIQTSYIEKVISSYSDDRMNLLHHAEGFPSGNELLAVTKPGNADGMKNTGNNLTSEGSTLIQAELLKEDTRPLWISIWGGASTLAQALFDLQKTETKEKMDELVKKIRIYDIAGQDDAGAWIAKNFPGIFYIRSQTQFSAMSQHFDKPGMPNNEERRGGNEYITSLEWLEENVQQYHGILGKNYPNPRYIIESSSPSFLYLLANGLSDPEHPEYGSWGGRFNAEPIKNVFSGCGELVKDIINENQYTDFYMMTDATDSWMFRNVAYQSIYAPVFRWREEIQNDFAARLDWTVAPEFEDANHNPVLNINGNESKDIIYMKAKAGDILRFDASSSSDPDNDNLYYYWWIYKEAGTYKGVVFPERPHFYITNLKFPADIKSGETIHLILQVSDNSEPILTSYRRVVISAE